MGRSNNYGGYARKRVRNDVAYIDKTPQRYDVFSSAQKF